MTSRREAALKELFGRELKRRLPGFYVLEYSTAGAPDREVVGCGVTTRWEFKHATPDFDSPANQELACCRLAHVGHCRYVLWREVKGIRETLIVHPLKVMRRATEAIIPEASCVDFDMAWLVRQVGRAHGV